MLKEHLKIILFFIIILLLFFFKPIFYDLSLVPAETLYHIDNIYKGYISQAENLPSNKLLFDLVFQMHPWQHFINESIQNVSIPLWNPYSLAGLPFLANHQSSLFELTKLFSYLFTIPVKDFILFSGFLILLLGGFFTYLFVRNLKISKTGSLISSLTFMFSGPVVVWLGYPLTNVIIWLPFLFLCLDKVVCEPKKMWVGLLALGIGWQFFGGNPEISWFVLFVSALYAFFRLSQYNFGKEKKYKVILRKAFPLIVALILGLSIASIQLIPTLEFLKQSEALSVGRGGLADYNVFEAIQHGQYNGWNNFKDVKHSLKNVVLLVYPDFFGSPVLGRYWKSDNYNESAFYVGIIPLILSLFSLGYIFKKNRKRKEIIFWISIALICLGIFLLFPVFRLVVYFPIFNIVVIGRLRFVFVFCLAVLAGYGIDYFLKQNKKQPKKKLIVFNSIYLAITTTIFLAVLIWRKFASQFPTQEMWHSEKILLLLLFLFINIVLWLILFSRIHSLKYNLGKGLLILLVAGELFYYGYNYHPAIPHDFVYPETQSIQFLQNNIGNYRFTSYKETLENFNPLFIPNVSSSLIPNGGILWNLQDIRGYEIIKIKRYEAFERHFGGVDDRFVYKFFDRKIFNTLGVKYFVQGKQDKENKILESIDNLSLVYSDQSINIYENKKVLPRAFLVFNIHLVENYKDALNVFLSKEFNPCRAAIIEVEKDEDLPIFNNLTSSKYQKAEIISYNPNKIEIQTNAQENAYLVLTDSYYLGWNAYLDGQKVKIYPSDVAFRGLFVPKGEHHIVFEYRPSSFYKSIYFSIFGLIVSIFLVISSINSKNK